MDVWKEIIIKQLFHLNYYDEARGEQDEHTFRVKYIFSVDEMKQIAKIPPSSSTKA